MFMSGASPEAGEFAARNQIGVGFAFTTVPLAKKAVAHYRASAEKAGWEPKADQVLYRALFHVADTDEQAFEDMSSIPARVSLANANKGISTGLLKSGYYGVDVEGSEPEVQRVSFVSALSWVRSSSAVPTLS